MKALTKTTLIVSSALALAACGGGGDDAPAGYSADAALAPSLMYAYPANGQHEVAPPSPVVLRFTSKVAKVDAQSAISLHRGGAGGATVDTDLRLSPDLKGVILTPDQPLKPHQHYTVVMNDLVLASGTANDRTLSFTTRSLQEGPRSAVVESPDFSVARHFPSGGQNEPVMDFSTFRLQFTQPIDEADARYGDGPNADVALLDQDGVLVPATLIIAGPYMTVDPDPQYLDATQQYTLKLGADLASVYADDSGQPKTLGTAVTFEFTPEDSTPGGIAPAVMVQHITDSNNNNVLSPLTGKPVNVVAVKGTLLGENGANATQASAVVRAELADPITYTKALPLRIPKGTLLTGTSIDIKIGGHVDAGYDSGEVTMTLISDATGYMVRNPYSTRPDAPRIVHLFMDVGVTTADPRANGGFTQDLLHIGLIGTAQVNTDAGVLNLNAISVVQPDVLGLEYGYSVLSFQLESYADQTAAPTPVADNTAPEVQSWTFGIDDATGLNKTAMLQPTDPLIINFNEPLDPQSVLGKVHLIKDESGTKTELDASVTVDGAAIVINPAQPLEHPRQTEPEFSYEVVLDSGITDVAGNAWAGTTAQGGPFDGAFALATLADQRDLYKRQPFLSPLHPDPWSLTLRGAGVNMPLAEHSPYLLAVYPGFPCALNTSDQDLARNIAGRCKGGVQPGSIDPSNLSGLTPSEMAELPPYDDLLPVPEMPANRPIIVVFSKAMDPASIELGRTFNVYKVDAQDQILATVEGQLSLQGDTLRFMPSTPWEKGALYRYVLKSNGDISSPTVDDAANRTGPLCNVNTMMCGKGGLPLQTQLMAEISFHDIAKPPTRPSNGARYTPYLVWEDKKPSLTGGGPDFVQYFRGTASTQSVLQLLRLSDTIDANANLFNDSTPQIKGPPPLYIRKLNGKVAMGGSLSYGEALFSEYAINETDQVVWQPDSSTAGLVDRNGVPMDPNGVKPPPNSAKILSMDMGDRSMAEVAAKGYDTDGLTGPDQGIPITALDAMVGMVIGCGYESYVPYPDHDQTGCDQGGQQEFYTLPGGGFVRKGTCYMGIPAVCPHDKFTYLTGALFAEVTKQTTASGGIKVRIYPGHMVTTSFRSFTKAPLRNAKGENVADSGYQLMRMRYVNGQPIEGVIKNGPDGPQLNTSVGLYMNAPYLVSDLVIRKGLIANAHHNLYSYPVSMMLSGPLSFLSDGRMVINQWNENALTIRLRMDLPALSVDLLVPEGGTHIRYVSQPIKQAVR